MRDLRDPQKLGEAYDTARQAGLEIEWAVQMPTPAYEDGGHISNDPAKHHSRTPQNLGNLDDGGAS